MPGSKGHTITAGLARGDNLNPEHKEQFTNSTGRRAVMFNDARGKHVGTVVVEDISSGRGQHNIRIEEDIWSYDKKNDNCCVIS